MDQHGFRPVRCDLWDALHFPDAGPRPESAAGDSGNSTIATYAANRPIYMKSAIAR